MAQKKKKKNYNQNRYNDYKYRQYLKEKEERHKKRLFWLFILTFLTGLSLTVSTYAWFTTNRIVMIDLIDVKIRTQGGIEISADGSLFKPSLSVEDLANAIDTNTGAINQLPAMLDPISSALELENGMLKMFRGNAENLGDGYYLSSFRSVETNSINDDNASFVAFDIYLKTQTNTDLFITPVSNIKCTDETKCNGIENSVRVAFVNQGTMSIDANLAAVQSMITNDNSNVYVWEPNYNVHTEFGIENALNNYGITTSANGTLLPYYGVKAAIPTTAFVKVSEANSIKYPEYFKKIDVDYYSPANFTENFKIFPISMGITKLRVYMWIEGQDVDCEDMAAVGNVAMSLQISTNPS